MHQIYICIGMRRYKCLDIDVGNSALRRIIRWSFVYLAALQLDWQDPYKSLIIDRWIVKLALKHGDEQRNELK
jgi:hypothetical protein